MIGTTGTVDIYWNLHKLCWSIRRRGLLIAHAREVTLANARWVVQPAGQAKVRREQCKHVHAFARGHLVEFTPVGEQSAEPRAQAVDECTTSVRYDPYTTDTFQARHGYGDGAIWEPIGVSDLVHLDTRTSERGTHPNAKVRGGGES